MGQELKQGSGGSVPSAAFVDDQSGNNSLHMAANSRVYTTLIGQISQTSPGVITGMGGNASMTLPRGAMPVGLTYYGLTQASTGGSITIGIDTTSTYFLNGQNVGSLATGKGLQNPVSVTNLFLALALSPVGSSHLVTGYYSETATSGSGGPWYVAIDYIVPDPA